ncbi:MAG: glycosyltransferase [Verrucomicrobia bacterium]|nr:glycosyltransferase [Verrucomicrobiota bacterium]NBU11270.1 glycosyltransferase [Pseudomonadota bacterium]NDA66829.1 glycosyltransferase [Verrucomicrobiota bacterium]NDD38870.1 glycosyltransferase [Verrucomicrobiota bacterium]NDE98618.1 glycosyltransferase [Verrucomicrobiota bacterium]
MPEPISIIVPVYDEQDNVLPMAREVAAAFATVANDWELVFVDDGSRDETWKNICAAASASPRVRGVRHLRNAGQSAALWTGIQQTDRPLLATLDGDLQNNPADLPRLLQELGTCDFACGWRQNRQDSFVRRASSRVARAARSAALGAEFRDTGCALRVFRRAALEGIFGFNGLHRFLPIMVAGGGFRVREVPVSHRPRIAGVSKYGVWNRLGRGLFDLVGIAWYQRRRVRPVPVERTSASQ